MPKVEWRTGVYCLLNLVNGKRYVGSGASKNGILGRIRSHKDELRRGVHFNSYLQASWNKHGAKNFRFSILERCSSESCIEREQFWINFYRSAERAFGYNLSPTAGSTLGVKFSEESRAKLSKIAKNRPPMSQETRRKVAEAGIGRFPNEETRQKLIAAAQSRKEQTRETSRKLYFERSEETLTRMRQACGESNRERIWTQEMREKVSKSLQGKKRSLESRLKQSQTSRLCNRKISEEAKQRLAEIRRQWWANRRAQAGE